jgi:hypothetical protein
MADAFSISMRNLLAVTVTMLLSSCYAEQYPGGTVVGADVGGDLLEITPGVEVVADWDVPIFFADNYYWWWNDGAWYWSTWYRGGWSRAPHVPPYVAGISHRENYAHYRPQGWAPRDHRGGQPAREYGNAPMRGGGIHSRPAPHGGGHHR